jgi:hypothetical protein
VVVGGWVMSGVALAFTARPPSTHLRDVLGPVPLVVVQARAVAAVDVKVEAHHLLRVLLCGAAGASAGGSSSAPLLLPWAHGVAAPAANAARCASAHVPNCCLRCLIAS